MKWDRFLSELFKIKKNDFKGLSISNYFHLLFFALSFVLAIGINNQFKFIKVSVDPTIGLLTFATVSIALGAIQVDKSQKWTNRFFIMAGILICVAIALTGLIGDPRPSEVQGIDPVLTIKSPLLVYYVFSLTNFLGILGLTLFFSASFFLLINFFRK